jgi:hypothetical protein
MYATSRLIEELVHVLEQHLINPEVDDEFLDQIDVSETMSRDSEAFATLEKFEHFRPDIEGVFSCEGLP